MRPIAKQQDVLRFPLNELLGTPANVRLLRVLAGEVSGPVGAPEAADLVGLTEAGARRALRKLERTGFVELVGGGRAQRFQLRDSGPLSAAIRSLFRVERERYQQLVRRLREVLGELPEVDAAWIDAWPGEAGEPLHVGILGDSRSLVYLEDQVRQRIAEVERAHDLTIEIHLFTRADLATVPPNALLLAGHSGGSPTRGGTRHQDRDHRAAAMSRIIADLLDRDASLLNRARNHVAFLIEQDQGPATHDLREWRDILSEYSLRRLKDFLASDAARAQRLRQSSPFFAVLTSEQREYLLDRLDSGA